MLGRGVAGIGAKGEFVLEPRGPAIVHFVFGEIDAAVVPRVAVATVSRFHRHEGSFGGVA